MHDDTVIPYRYPGSHTPSIVALLHLVKTLRRKVVHSLVKLRRAGHKILIMGHSLGAGVATLLGPLVREVGRE